MKQGKGKPEDELINKQEQKLSMKLVGYRKVGRGKDTELIMITKLDHKTVFLWFTKQCVKENKGRLRQNCQNYFPRAEEKHYKSLDSGK